MKKIEEVFAPVVTGVPPSNAMNNLVLLPDGGIRCYGRRLEGDNWRQVYLESLDHGLCWQQKESPDSEDDRLQSYLQKEISPACMQSPYSGDLLYLDCLRFPDGSAQTIAWRSRDGLDGDWQCTPVSDDKSLEFRLPLFLKQRRRVLVATTVFYDRADRHVFSSQWGRALVFLSDDDGRSWRRSLLEGFGPFPISWPDKGMRWQNGAMEPTVAELSDGRLLMMIRTSTDNLYQSTSQDGGETWTAPQLSIFYGTCTMPTLHALPDGRLLFFWCNTTPFPEDPDLMTDDEAKKEWNRQGRVMAFTNRDAFHAAISADDGATWQGFRELLLNPIRNEADYALCGGGTKESVDKSVHQAQALDLPGGKVLLAVGQHPASRRLLVFDPDWLLETERREDFSRGLENWSVHQFIRGIEGHNALNRKAGAELVAHPDKEGRKVLRLRRIKDESLISDIQGALWNFPAGHAGRLSLRLMIPQDSRGGSISLLDRWFNPTDVTARARAMYDLYFDGRGSGYLDIEPGVWHNLEFLWRDLEIGSCSLFLDGKIVGELPLKRPSRCGISYLMLQGTVDGYDEKGFLLESISVKVGEGL